VVKPKKESDIKIAQYSESLQLIDNSDDFFKGLCYV